MSPPRRQASILCGSSCQGCMLSRQPCACMAASVVARGTARRHGAVRRQYSRRRVYLRGPLQSPPSRPSLCQVMLTLVWDGNGVFEADDRMYYRVARNMRNCRSPHVLEHCPQQARRAPKLENGCATFIQQVPLRAEIRPQFDQHRPAPVFGQSGQTPTHMWQGSNTTGNCRRIFSKTWPTCSYNCPTLTTNWGEHRSNVRRFGPAMCGLSRFHFLAYFHQVCANLGQFGAVLPASA